MRDRGWHRRLMVRVNDTTLAAIDELAENRSEFIRAAIDEKLRGSYRTCKCGAMYPADRTCFVCEEARR